MVTAICIASGPSLTKDDVEFCRGRGKVYVVNNCYQLAPWADVLYACDLKWWDAHHEEIEKKFQGKCWTVDTEAAVRYNLNMLGIVIDHPFSANPEAVATGGNSGYQALNLAVVQGATRVILLGYDMHADVGSPRHWHGNHPKGLLQTNYSEYKNWVENFRKAAPHIPVPVINCSRNTALNCFPRAALRDVL